MAATCQLTFFTCTCYKTLAAFIDISRRVSTYLVRNARRDWITLTIFCNFRCAFDDILSWNYYFCLTGCHLYLLTWIFIKIVTLFIRFFYETAAILCQRVIANIVIHRDRLKTLFLIIKLRLILDHRICKDLFKIYTYNNNSLQYIKFINLTLRCLLSIQWDIFTILFLKIIKC